MSGPRVLISGAGIAGSVLAYWLGKGGAQVTVIERDSELRLAGQGIDIDGPGLEVVRRMGVEETIRSKTTGELGISIMNDHGGVIANFDVSNDKKDVGFTSEIEIMRGDLCAILYNAANTMENVRFHFGKTIESLAQTPDLVTVKYSDNSKTKDFDFVIGADGLRSRTRELILGPTDSKFSVKSLDAYVAYFTIPREEQDGPRSRAMNATGGRSVLIRPRNDKVSQGLLSVIGRRSVLQKIVRQDVQAQKQAMAETFAGIEWEVPRVVRAMLECDDFYLQEVAQVKLPKNCWSRDRCAFVGDAACCPSAITGKGTTLAILTAYVLAGEILQSPEDPAMAFKGYEDKLRDYVENAQNIPLGGYAPLLVNPQTAWGIWILRTVVLLVYKSGITKFFGGFGPDKFELPDYRFGGER